jgi:hypothetical protein
MDAPVKIAIHIPPDEMDEIKADIGENFPAVTILEPTLKEMSVSSALQ